MAQFEKGHLKVAGSGRRKGTPNRRSALLSDAILKAASLAGGKDGLVGYLKVQAVSNPQLFMGLLAKFLSMQVAAEPDIAPPTIIYLDAADAKL